MELRTVDLATCVQAAVDAVTPAAEMKRLGLEVDLDASLAPVPGDPARLQQVVWNLLTNAVKFTPEGGRVRLTVDAAEGRGRIRVTDTGVGIDAAFVPHLFDRFSQEDRGQTRAHGGLGLGLAIVRHLVTRTAEVCTRTAPGRGRAPRSRSASADEGVRNTSLRQRPLRTCRGDHRQHQRCPHPRGGR
jgi:signal transduction histidine kinase